MFAAEDPYRNIVRLERDTWEGHITRKHHEVAGMESWIKRLIESPDFIFESTLDHDVAIFQNVTLRAAVLYEIVEYVKGSSFGKVTTVYPNDGLPLSTIGQIVFRRPDGDRAK